MKNLKVSLKLIVSFLIAIALAVIVGVCGVFGMNMINTSGNDLYTYNFVPSVAMGNVNANFYELRGILQDTVIHTEAADLQNDQSNWADVRKQLEENMTTYEVGLNSEEDRAGFEAMRKLLNEWLVEAEEVLRLGFENQAEEAYAKLMASRETANKATGAIDGLLQYNLDTGTRTSNDTDTQFFTLTVVMVSVLAASVVITLILALYLSGLIAKPLVTLTALMKRAASAGDINITPQDAETIRQYGLRKDEIGQTIGSCASFIERITAVAKGLEIIAGGDLTADIEIQSKDDTIGNSLNNTLNNLNNMFAEINSAASQVSTGSKQVADGAQSLAQGSTEQAATIEELSSSITEIAEKTKANAETADKTAKLSATIKENAEKGSHQMDGMIEAVKDINDASQSIGKIIKTIDDIAFQTNILALNAAVEAARAGQHGKGFAVVAEEVRNLASKSAEAAKETGNMIQNSMEKAELGSRIAGETAESLAEIVSGINESSQLVAEIAISSEQQSEGVAQINTGIGQVSQVVQQNSATAQESAAAAEEMSGQSDMLQSLISRFKLKNRARAQPRAPVAASREKRSDAPPEDSDYSPDVSAGDFGKY